MSFERNVSGLDLGYAAAGIVMGASHDHGQHVTHANILLRFVASLGYDVINMS